MFRYLCLTALLSWSSLGAGQDEFVICGSIVTDDDGGATAIKLNPTGVIGLATGVVHTFSSQKGCYAVKRITGKTYQILDQTL